MKRLFCLLVVCGIASFCIFSSLIAGPSPQKIEKMEKVDIIDIVGLWENELGDACVIKKEKEVYVLGWTNTDLGIGQLRGNTLSVGFIPNSVGARVGIAIYHLERDGNKIKLVGQFTTLPGDGSWGSEILTKVKDSAKR